MSADVLLVIPALVLILALGVCPSVAMLKQKYILFVIGLVLVALALTLYEPGSPGSSVTGGIGQIVWITAAVRLAPPASRWARQCYGPEKLARARQRPAGLATPAAHETGEPPVSEARPARPRLVTVATALVSVGTAVQLLGLGAATGGFLAGAVLPVLWLVREGWLRGRTVVTVIGGLVVVGTVVRAIAAGPTAVGWVVLVATALLVVAGLVLLRREPVDGYLRAATR